MVFDKEFFGWLCAEKLIFWLSSNSLVITSFSRGALNIIAQMVQKDWGNRFEKALLRYYRVEWWQRVTLVIYFLVEAALSILLTLLPIKLAFNDVLQSQPGFQTALDILAVVVFCLHVYLYLNYKAGKLVRNPEIQKKWLLQNRVIKLRWLNLLTAQLLYDLLCMGIAIWEATNADRSLAAILLELVYLLKIYKIKKFNDRIQSQIIGTGFYLLYNVLYGLFILIILVSYVGCIFYLIDYLYYQNNYEYPQLLWIVTSGSWNQIINQGFGVQLLYSMYWSLGTASAAAYGDISASAPPDIVYNILCLYFEGFLFGFYLSRIHSLPQSISRKENQLLQLFQKFQEHNQQIKDRGQTIPTDLYFKILCSLEYQESRKKSLTYIEAILPEQYIVEIKTHVFKGLLQMDPFSLWGDNQIRRQLSLVVVQLTTQLAQQLYDYSAVSFNDLLFVKSGHVHSYIEIDHQAAFPCFSQAGQVLGGFGFLTNLYCRWLRSKLMSYSVVLLLSREDIKKVFGIKELVKLQQLFQKALDLRNEGNFSHSLAKYSSSLTTHNSSVLFMNPSYTCNFTLSLIAKQAEQFLNVRKDSFRTYKSIAKVRSSKSVGRVSVGVQCEPQTQRHPFETVLII